MSALLLRRFNVMNFNQRVDQNRLVQEMGALIELQKQKAVADSPRKVKVAVRYRYWQALMHILEAWIESSINYEPSVDICAAFQGVFANELWELGYPVPGPSQFQRIMTSAMANCKFEAIISVLCMEFGELTGKEFNTRLASNRIGHRLWVNSHHMVKAIGDHWHMLVNPLEQLVRKALVSSNSFLLRKVLFFRSEKKVALHWDIAHTKWGAHDSAYDWKSNAAADPSYLTVGEKSGVSNFLGGGPSKSGAMASNGISSYSPEKQEFLSLAYDVLNKINTPGFAEAGSNKPSVLSIIDILSKWKNLEVRFFLEGKLMRL